MKIRQVYLSIFYFQKKTVLIFNFQYNKIWRDTYMNKVKDQSEKFKAQEGVEMDAILDVRKVLVRFSV